MVRISVLHDALKTMNNAERKGKRQALVRPSSKVVIKFLQVMMKHGASGVRLAAASAGQQRFPFGISCDQSCTRCQQLGMLHTTSLCFKSAHCSSCSCAAVLHQPGPSRLPSRWCSLAYRLPCPWYRLHWRGRAGGRPPGGQDCSRAQRQVGASKAAAYDRLRLNGSNPCLAALRKAAANQRWFGIEAG